MNTIKIDMGEFIIYHSSNLSGNIELIFSSNMNANYNSIVNDNQCYIAVKDFNQDNIKVIEKWVINVLKDKGYNKINKEIKVVVKDEKEEKNIDNLKFDDGFKAVIDRMYKKDNKNEQKAEIKNKEENFEDYIDKYLQYNTITKMDNGIMRKYVQRISDDENNSYMLEDVSSQDIFNKYNELLNNDNFKNKIINMSSLDIAKEVMDAIALSGNKKKYFLSSSLEQGTVDKKGSLSSNIAYQNDGGVNTEIGVIENGADKSNRFTTVEEDNDKLRSVNPEVTTSSVSSNNVNSSVEYKEEHSYATDELSEKNDIKENLDNEQEREMLKTNVKKRVLTKKYSNSTGIISLIEICLIFLIIGLLFSVWFFIR